ncbi:MAG: GHKL domain-containing protein [Ruminococcus sp.]|nr:GHKL domain-containing protein [Ruminococcus sp.]
MFLCLLPFDDSSFRYSYRKVLSICGLLALISSAFFPFAVSIQGNITTSPYLAILANGYMLLAISSFGIFYFWSLRVERIKKIIVLVLVLFYAATQYLIVNLVSTFFKNYDQSEVYSPIYLALFVISAAMTFPFSALFMRRALRDYLAEVEIKNIQREFVIVIFATFLYLAMLVVYMSGPGSYQEVFWWWIAPPLLLAIAVLCFFYWTLFKESVRRKRDSEELKSLEIRNVQYNSITREMEQTRRLRHDMRHMLNHLSLLVEQGSDDELKSYLSEMTALVISRENTDYCKNPTVNGLLQYYTSMAADSDIDCRVKANCGDLEISSTDLTVILGNMIENAIHACLIDNKNRWINIEVAVISGSMIIQVINPCQEVLPSGMYKSSGSFVPASAFLSTRRGGGYGLQSIENTAKKYSGEALFRFDNQTETFTARVRLNIHAAEL